MSNLTPGNGKGKPGQMKRGKPGEVLGHTIGKQQE
jgi:hypothetical protein